MAARTKILLVEDDPSIQILLKEELSFQGFEARTEDHGERGYHAAVEWVPDLIILDLMLPGLSGLEICKRLRDDGLQTPIILLTARDQETDKVVGLDAGANDYVTKPFGVAELMARVRAQLREHERSLSQGVQAIAVGDLRLHPQRLQAYRGEQAVELTRREFEILRMVLEADGGTVSRDEFLDTLWPGTFVTPRTIDTHVSSLRKKVGTFGDDDEYIVGVRGVGYRLNPKLSKQE